MSARVGDGRLWRRDDASDTAISLDSPAWLDWLRYDDTSSFSYRRPAGALLCFVGVALLVGGVARDLLRLSGVVIWPALLILAGLALLLGASAHKSSAH